MNVLVVDTSCWISYFDGKSMPEIDLGLQEGRVFLSPIVAAELLSARLKEIEREKMVSFLKELPLCDASIDHWIRVGQLRSRCSTSGIHVSTPDAHITQCTLDLGGYLISADQIFKKIVKSTSLRLLEL